MTNATTSFWVMDDPEEGTIDASETLHRCIDAVNAGKDPDTVAKRLFDDDLATDDNVDQLREEAWSGWEDLDPNGPSAWTLLALENWDGMGLRWVRSLDVGICLATIKELKACKAEVAELLELLAALCDPSGGESQFRAALDAINITAINRSFPPEGSPT
jgi:hypothetical protein